ncbi:MAG TPA: hypothetical protein VF160_15200 [Candidatus Dormibacteraeota bacterium]
MNRSLSHARQRSHWVLALVTALVAFALAATPALADGPVRQPVINMPGQLPAGSFCSFAINVSFPVNNEYSKTLYDTSGNPVRTLVNGHLVIEFQNASTGNAVTLNLSGPGQIVYSPDGSQTITFLGNSAVFLVQGSQPTLSLTSGRLVANVPVGSLTGLGTLFEAAGRSTNICDVLA